MRTLGGALVRVFQPLEVSSVLGGALVRAFQPLEVSSVLGGALVRAFQPLEVSSVGFFGKVLLQDRVMQPREEKHAQERERGKGNVQFHRLVIFYYSATIT